jgi:hypothetical protein
MIRRMLRTRLPTSGFNATPTHSILDGLSDADLTALNRLLPWHAYVVDGRGRRFGDSAWAGKRPDPQTIPDSRVTELDTRFQLADKTVLEFGCFEGIHTVALCQLARDVIAIDSRIENVAKTLVRAAMFDCWPRVYCVDVEAQSLGAMNLHADVAHHVGVFYHLHDPVSHLVDLGRHIRVGIMLDTHVATPDQVNASYRVEGCEWRYHRKAEGGRSDPFSGMYGHAKWLPLDELTRLLAMCGFPQVEVAEERNERNGLRVKIFARRSEA